MTQPGKGPVITWYDVLGVLPGASAEQVKSQHDAKVSMLRPALLTGAASPVVMAATRGREILDAAQRVIESLSMPFGDGRIGGADPQEKSAARKLV